MIDLPEASYVEANGLRHHLLTFGEGPRTVVALHGYLDSGYGLSRFAERLATRGLRVVCPDFRGHGRTEWAAPSGYYYFPDYLVDLEGLLDALGLETVDLVGHSMGGTVATLYAGARPKRVRRLVTIEGLGPLESPLADTPDRYTRFLDGLARVRSRGGRPIRDLDDALDRMRTMHPTLPDDFGRALADYATAPHPSGTGLRWRFDPRHQTQSPVAFRLDAYLATVARIAAPTLVVLGEKGLRTPDEDARIAAIPDARKAVLAGQGHMMHWHAPELLAAEVAAFLTGADV